MRTPPTALSRTLLGLTARARRGFSTSSAAPPSSSSSSSSSASPLKTESNANRDLILSILNLTTTRRETNTYLSKYSSSLLNATNNDATNTPATVDAATAPAPFRLLFCKIRGNLYNLPQGKLKQLQTTLSYLIQLGNLPIIVLDSSELLHQKANKPWSYRNMDSYLSDQFNLLSVALNDSVRVQPVRSSLTVQGAENVIVLDQKGSVLVENYAENATVPVLYPYVYDANTGHNLLCDSSEFMKYMFRELLKLNKNKKEKEVVSVEKIIFIDELGGIPSIERRSNAHVFINLSQEFEEIQSELHIGHLYDLKQRDIHTHNLEDMEMLLEEGITGLITTLDIAIENHKMNPIIYNVLTDRSLVSSSLSTNKISNDDVQDRITKTTIFKKGLTVTVLNSLDEVDLVKLKQLIDDSFKRSLNLDHYVSRVKGNINKIVIVGDYDGCAIVTNEVSQATGLEFPYLDKFAISRAAQGSLGVADMIFNVLMKQVAKRNVLIWRSKKRNPVNGWYFQRSNGSFTLNEKSEFRLFWSGGNGKWDELAFRAFVDIVEGIEPSFET